MTRACSHCGWTADVILDRGYVGGVGYVSRWLCRDSAACWRRWDEAHGLLPPALADQPEGGSSEPRACSHCGSTADMLEREYIRRVGYTDRWLCRDSAACWRRWDEAHGLRPPALADQPAPSTVLATLQQWQQELGFNDSQFARFLGVPRVTWVHAKRGRRKVGLRLIRAAIGRRPDLMDLVVKWLLTGPTVESWQRTEGSNG